MAEGSLEQSLPIGDGGGFSFVQSLGNGRREGLEGSKQSSGPSWLQFESGTSLEVGSQRMVRWYSDTEGPVANPGFKVDPGVDQSVLHPRNIQ